MSTQTTPATSPYRQHSWTGVFCADNFFFAMMQGLFWSGFGILVVYLIGYLEALGYDSLQIGIVRAGGAVGAVSGALLWSTIADKSGKIGTLSCIVLLCGVALFPLFAVADGVLVPTTLVFAIVSFFLFPMPTLIDSWITQMANLNPLVNYGVTRSMGSLGFATTAVIAGRIFDAHGIELVFPAYAMVLALLLPFILLQTLRTQRKLRDPRGDGSQADRLHSEEHRHADGEGVKHSARVSRLLNRPFATFLGICALLMPCFVAAIVFMPLLITAAGGTHRHVGLAFSVMAFSEIPFMICSAVLLRRFRDTRVIAIALIFFFFRLLGFVVAQGPTGLIAVQVLQGGSFALFLPAAIALCSRIVRRSHRTRALALLGFMFFGISEISASLIGAWLINRYDVRTMYAVMSVAILVPIAAYWWLFIVRSNLRHRRLLR